jgi:hypothetical protein
MKNAIRLFVLFVTCWLILPAQVNTGSISGSVSDPSGAMVPGAKITLRNEATGVETTVTAGDAGLLRSNFVVPGTYSVRVES